MSYIPYLFVLMILLMEHWAQTKLWFMLQGYRRWSYFVGMWSIFKILQERVAPLLITLLVISPELFVQAHQTHNNINFVSFLKNKYAGVGDCFWLSYGTMDLWTQPPSTTAIPSSRIAIIAQTPPTTTPTLWIIPMSQTPTTITVWIIPMT